VWEANQQRQRAQHGAHIVALAARQTALRGPTVEWVWNDVGTYPTLADSSPRFAMGVGVMCGDRLHAVICPVASRITPGLAGWFSSAVIVVADESERARVAAVCQAGQSFHVIDPGPLELPAPPQGISIQQGPQRRFGSC
jgi:competence protein CoiA